MVMEEPVGSAEERRNGAPRRRSVPQDPAAERAVIGSVLLSPGVMDRISATVLPDDFLDPRHRVLFGAALDVWQRGEKIDSITVGAELERRGRLEEAGGHAYMAELQADQPTTVGVEHHAQLVQRAATYRGMISAAGVIADLAYRADPNVEATLTEAVDELYSVRGADQRRGFRPLQDLLAAVLAEDEDAADAAEPVRTGFADLDSLLNGGMHPSDLVVLAARPSVGKSALALAIARNAALGQNATVAMFSLEMSAEQVAARLVSAESGVEYARLPAGRHTDEQEHRISSAIASLSRAEIYIDDTAGQRLADIRTKARNLHKLLRDQRARAGSDHGGLQLIIIDHIQLVHAYARAPIETNRVAEMSDISRTLKEVARELRVPVLALSQLSRAIESRHPPVPRLSDLRDSGSIEQDADVVIFLTRADRNGAGGDGDDDLALRPNEVAGLSVAKHRHGKTGPLEIRFVPSVARFEDFYYIDASPEEQPERQ